MPCWRCCYPEGVAFRIDTVKISNVKRTPQGGLDVPAALTRSGIFVYRQPDGTVQRELRPAEEVFSEDSLQTLGGAPVTVGHPGLVHADNWQRVSVGHVADTAKRDGDLVESRVRVQHSDAVKDVESKKLVELSCGYTCDVDHTPGDFGGEHYDAVQRNIRYNHVALLPPGGGRAGSEVKLRMDGASYAVSMDLAEALKEIDRLNGALTGEKTRADALDAKFKAIDVDALVNDRLALVQDARSILGSEVKLDGKDDKAIMREACQSAFPEVKLDEKASEDYLRGLFQAGVVQAKASGAAVARGHVQPRADAIDDKVKGARERMEARSKDAWKGN